MTRVIWKDMLNKVAIDHFALAVSLYPEGKDMRYVIHSAWLVEQWNDMMPWKSLGYVGLD
jgi:hypothetical protein